jgi:hypothetical protein
MNGAIQGTTAVFWDALIIIIDAVIIKQVIVSKETCGATWHIATTFAARRGVCRKQTKRRDK